MNNIQIKSISIKPDGKVKIAFNELIAIGERPEGNIIESDEDEPNILVNEYSVRSPQLAHKDFLDAMKKLRKHALDICEIVIDAKNLTSFTVSEVRLDGDIALRQARVQFILSKEVKRTDKQIKIGPTPQTTLYGESEYEGAEALAKLVEAVVSEAFAYLEGKGENEAQLPLFPTINIEMPVGGNGKQKRQLKFEN